MKFYQFRRILVHLLLFCACLSVAGGMMMVRSFTDNYSVDGSACTSYEQTSDFEQHFYKYVERVSAYTALRNQGYEPDASVSGINGRAIRGSDFRAFPTDTEQAQVEFYNRKLNGGKTSFLYYVEGIAPSADYISPQLQKLCSAAGNDPVTQIKKMVNEGAPYFIIYNSGIYNTNLDNYGFLTPSVRSYLLEGEGFKTLYALSSGNFEGSIDDFSDGYHLFARARSLYQIGRTSSAVGLICTLVFLGFALFLCGYPAGYRLPEGETDPAAIRRSKRSQVDLRGFDRVPAEVALLGCILVYLLLRYFLLGYLWDAYLMRLVTENRDLVYFFLQFTLSYLFFVPYFFSLVRRYKAGTLFSGLFVVRGGKKLMHWIRRFFENRSITMQAGILLLLFFVGGFLALGLLYLAGMHMEGFYLILGLLLYIVLFLLLAHRILRTCADLNIIIQETEQIQDGSFDHKVPESLRSVQARTLGGYINNIGQGLENAVAEQVKSERLKTALITNVSHDIKTPLTSIINYVDLLKRMDLDNEKANGYLEILNNKSWRLKNLIEDLVEASKASSGAITLQCERLNYIELIRQSCAEYEDRFAQRHLSMITSLPDHPVYIFADGRRTFRIIENLLSNAGKYALEGTRVYVDVDEADGQVSLSIKNISATQLNISAEELMERFVRGDQSRSTEGSGLGLSIAESLAKLQGADFRLDLDGDLFKATLTFPVYHP
ncbi:MAG: HAMP domain-containing histidine kinase [Lachnospiraceae bacterium]|nr:HAMP domain-containing histidine kinase [Lachnospiraceae bacterium]